MRVVNGINQEPKRLQATSCLIEAALELFLEKRRHRDFPLTVCRENQWRWQIGGCVWVYYDYLADDVFESAIDVANRLETVIVIRDGYEQVFRSALRMAFDINPPCVVSFSDFV